MVRTTLLAFGLMAAGAGHAQQTIDEALDDLRVFDCTLDATQVIYVFRGSGDDLSLVGDAETPVRVTENGLSIMTASGPREISDGAYYVYSSGNAESGTCRDITEFAQTLYPAVTAAYTPDAAGGTVAEQAAAAAITDLTTRTERAEANAAAAEATADEAVTARTALEAELAEARATLATQEADLATLRPEVQEQAGEIAVLSARVDDLTTELAAALAQRDAFAGDVETLNATAEALTEERDALETEAAVTIAKLVASEAELAELTALHTSATAAATDFQGQLGEMNDKLADVTATNRALTATVTGLNTKISETLARLSDARAERDAAVKRAETAGTAAGSVSGLTDAAIRQLATLQGRSQNAVRSELCRIIGRGGGC